MTYPTTSTPNDTDNLPPSFWLQLGLGVDLANSRLDSALCALNRQDERPTVVAQGRGVGATAGDACRRDSPHQLAASDGSIVQASPSSSLPSLSVPSWSCSADTGQSYRVLQLSSSQHYTQSSGAMEGSSENAPHDMAAQQEAAKEYRPDIQVSSSSILYIL